MGISVGLTGTRKNYRGNHMSARTKNAVVAFLAVVLGTAVLGAVVAGAAAALRPETYTSTATVMVAPDKALPNAQTDSVSQYVLSNMPTYNNLATTTTVLQEAADHGRSTDEISQHLAVEVPTGSTLIKLAYTDTDRERSAAVADDLAAGLQKAIREYSPRADGTSQVDVTIVQDGASATSSSTPQVSRWATVGGVVGAIVGLAAAQALSTRRAKRARDAGSSAAARTEPASS